MLKWGIIKQKVDGADLITNELIDEINKFDAAKVTAEAKSLQGALTAHGRAAALSTTPRYVTIAKDALAVLREGLLVIGFLVLLLLPERFNGLLERAGFTKGSLLGFEWQKVIKESTDQAKGAGDAISQVEGRLKDFDDRLRALDRQSSDPRVKRRSLRSRATSRPRCRRPAAPTGRPRAACSASSS